MASQAYSATQMRPHRRSELTVRVEKLLRRYPNLSEEELATLIETFPQLPMLDAALMTADDHLSNKVEAFHREHGRKIRSTWPSIAAALAFPAVLALILLWWAIT